MFSVYVIQHDVTTDLYIGRTNDLRRRLREHNASRNKSTHRRTGEWVLIYAEAYRAREDAIRRELRLKSHGRSKQELFKRIASSQIH